MNTYEENLQYEEKMDRISEELEEMVLDTMIAVLKKYENETSTSQDYQIRLSRNPFLSKLIRAALIERPQPIYCGKHQITLQ